MTISIVIGLLLRIFIENPIKIGYARFLLDVDEKQPEENSLKTLFSYFFKGRYTRALVAIFTTELICGLWALLFIVPGVIKSYEYRMVEYLLAEDDSMTGKEARAKSKEMMAGNKWNSFVLDLSFFGWGILSAASAGILGVFWVKPYYHMTDCELYKAIKNGN